MEILEDDLDDCTPAYQNDCKLPFACSTVSSADVLSNKILSSPDAVKTYMEMCLKISYPFDYLPGESFGILCENTDADVRKVCEHLNIYKQLDNICHIYVLPDSKKAKAKLPDYLPSRLTLRSLLKTCLDLRTVPKKLFLRALVDHTSDEGENRRLQELCSKQVSIYFFLKYIQNEVIHE